MKGMNEMDKEYAGLEIYEMLIKKVFTWVGKSCKVCIVVWVIAAIGYFLFGFIAQPREAIHHASISNNLKQWGVVFKMYADENPGKKYPPLTQYNDLWVPDLSLLYPEYMDADIITDPRIHNTMSEEIFSEPPGEYDFDAKKWSYFMAQNYVYPGWVIQNTSDVEMIKKLRLGEYTYESVIEGNEHLRRLREGAERFLITDVNNPWAAGKAQSQIPLMIARPRPQISIHASRWWFNFKQKYLGYNPPLFVLVLYMDGHVEVTPLNDAPEHIKALAELFPEPIEDNQDNEN